MKSKKALIMNAGFSEIESIKALKDVGYQVVAIGGKPNQPGQPYVDEYIQLDYSDKEAALALAQKLEVDMVFPCCHDFGVLTASYIAEKMGLQGHDTYEAALTLHQKDRFKAFARLNDIPTPQSEWFHDRSSALEYATKVPENRPLIVKASDMCTGRGCTRIQDRGELPDAINYAFEASRKKSILIEPYIDGDQHAICTFLIDRKVAAYCSNDEFSFVNPYRVEIDTFPATDIEKHAEQLINEIEKMADLLNLTNGIFEMQYRVDSAGQIWIIECMRRILGNLYSVPASKYSGFNWGLWETKAKRGLDCHDFPRDIKPSGNYAYRALIPPRNGIFKSLHIDDSLKPYLMDEFMVRSKGDIITDNVYDNIGFLFFSFPTKEMMHNLLVDLYDSINICVEDA